MELHAVMWERGSTWFGRLQTASGRTDCSAPTREALLAELRRLVGAGATLTVEVVPALVGVAEAAAILGWDRRRIVTYVDRGSFPKPLASLASGRVWRRSEVEDFARAFRGRNRKASA